MIGGTAVATLTGLMFVAITLIAGIEMHVPTFKDWLWYTAFPLISYIVLIVAAVALQANPGLPLYIISAVMVVLLFLGIHNAWDLVTYLAVGRSHSENKSQG